MSWNSVCMTTETPSFLCNMLVCVGVVRMEGLCICANYVFCDTAVLQQ